MNAEQLQSYSLPLSENSPIGRDVRLHLAADERPGIVKLGLSWRNKKTGLLSGVDMNIITTDGPRSLSQSFLHLAARLEKAWKDEEGS